MVNDIIDIDEDALLKKLDVIIGLLKEINKPLPLYLSVLNGIATGAGILGVISIIDVIKNWLGG